MNSQPALTVIVVFHNMAREAPRTLFTFSPQYQRGVCPGDYEVIVVDAGSSAPLEETFVKSFGENFQLVRAPAAPSPVVAVNRAATLARGEAIASTEKCVATSPRPIPSCPSKRSGNATRIFPI